MDREMKIRQAVEQQRVSRPVTTQLSVDRHRALLVLIDRCDGKLRQGRHSRVYVNNSVE